MTATNDSSIVVDVENTSNVHIDGPRLERRMLALEKEEAALDKILQMQQDLLTSMEEMRRNIASLETKRTSILYLRAECHDFLEAAAELDESNEVLLVVGSTAEEDEREEHRRVA